MLEIFSAFGLSASAGLNAYIPIMLVAISSRLGWIELGEKWEVLSSWPVIIVVGILLIIEVVADKIPAVDSLNDIIGTFVRPAAGAILFAASTSVITEMPPVASAILGLLVAGSVHTVKAVSRPVFTATTAGLANPVVSTVEDVFSTLLALVAVILPWLVLLVAVTGITLFLWWRLRRAERKRQKAAMG
jgi:uncharacterized membrane protein